MAKEENNTLSKGVARTGMAVVVGGLVFAILLQTPLLPITLHDSNSLIFLPGYMSVLTGLVTLRANIRQASLLPRIVVNIVSVSILIMLTACLILTVLNLGDTSLAAVEVGIIITQITFFLFAAGIDGVIKLAKNWISRVMIVGWFSNIVAMTIVIVVWSLGHLHDGDSILTAAFMGAYALMPSTKYWSLTLTSPLPARKALGMFILPPILLGWLYLSGLTHPELLPSWVLNATLYAGATEFGVCYAINGLLHGKTEVPRTFFPAMAFQAMLMVVAFLVGVFIPTGAPLIVGLILMESLPNLFGAIDMVSELWERGWYRYSGYAIMLVLLIVLSASAIIFQQYGLLAGGITITLLQSTPWTQVGQSACIRWPRDPARALKNFLIVLSLATAVCIGLALWMTRLELSVTALVALWYTVARVPSAISLGRLGLLGIKLVGDKAGDKASKEWRYLLWGNAAIMATAFIWFSVLLLGGHIEALVAPALIIQFGGGVNVTQVFPTFSSDSFKEKANEALAARAASVSPPRI